MLGYTAHATGDPTLQPDHDEIAEAGWFTRDEVRAARDWGDERGEEGSQEGSGAQGMLRALPPTMSIARQLIDSWIASG
jgi:NAD+ diphosphatase